MKILVLNCGSSSLKYQLINMENEEVIAKGNYERIGEEEAFLTHKINGQSYLTKKGVKSHDEALVFILTELLNINYPAIHDLTDIDAVGHRVVHGGEIFGKSVLIDDEVIGLIEECSALAPLHNPAALLGIRACMKQLPNTKMVATFDTAFHKTMPEESYLYSIPKRYYEKYKIRKYGFHGTSHQYVSGLAAKHMNKSIEELKIVTCHLGQGASICAVKNGESFDTSMGLTPLGGISMVTRCGDLDPSVVLEMMDKERLTIDEATTILNKKSGISAISGLQPDFREIEQASYKNEEAKVAIDIFNKSVAGFVAKYAAFMKGIDAIVFTGGIGENQINIRKSICEYLEVIGVKLDLELNDVKSEEREISTKDSKVKVYVIPTNEELVIAKDTTVVIKE